MDSEYVNLIAFAVAIIISIVALGKGMQRFFLGLAVVGIIASFALNIFTSSLSGPLNKVCMFVIIILFAAKIFKKIAAGNKGGVIL